MADVSSWKQVATIAQKTQPCLLVVSATSGTTDMLIESAYLAEKGEINKALEYADNIKSKHEEIVTSFATEESIDLSVMQPGFDHINNLYEQLKHFLNGIYTLEELTSKTMDSVSCIGEQLSSRLLADCCRAASIPAEHIDAREVIKTDATHGEAHPLCEEINNAAGEVKKRVGTGKILIMGGFYGSSPEGKTTTLGRGGSDFTASLMAEALDADAVDIWTDVSGMYTCDPRVVPEAKYIPEISFNEAAELAYFGARVLHPATIQPAIDRDIPVYIKNTFEPDHPGTAITSVVKPEQNIKAIAFKRDITLITITSSRMLMAYGFLSKVFSVFEHFQLPVDLVTTSEVSVTMSIDQSNLLDELINALESYGQVSVDRHQALLCVVGNNFLQSRGIANRVFGALADIPVRMISQGSSDMNLSLVIANEYVEKGARALHDEFFG